MNNKKFDYSNLIVWQKAMEVAKDTYQLTKSLPKQELYGIGDQIRRSSISIPSNIAEGYGRHSKNDFARFLMIAKGSACELETQLILAKKLNCFETNSTDPILKNLGEIKSMLHVLARNLKSQT